MLHALADDAMRTDVRGGINLRAGRDDGRGMNAGGEGSFRERTAPCALAKAMRAFGTRIRIFFAEVKRLSAMMAVAALCLGAREKVLIFGKSQVARPWRNRRGQSLSALPRHRQALHHQ